MNTKTVYQTNAMGLYVGPIKTDPSPLEPGVFLIPAGCVLLPPPDVPPRKAAHWSGKMWQLLDYFDGLVVYRKTDGEPLTVTGPGPVPNGYTEQKPGPQQVWKKNRWVDDLNATLAKQHAQQLEKLNDACATYIKAGFICDASGALYRYDSGMADQVDLTSLILSGLESAYPCYEADGKKLFLLHSAEQLHCVGQRLVAFKLAAYQHAETLKKALGQAVVDKDLDALNAIAWSVPA